MSTLPGPKDHSFGLSLARRMQSDFLAFSEEMAREFGDLAFFRVGPIKVCILNHPNLIHEALSTQLKAFPKNPRAIRQLAKMDGQAITVTEGDVWRRGRKTIQPVFHASRLPAQGEIILRATRDMLEQWTPGQAFDAEEEVRRLTLRIMTRTLFGDAAAGRGELIENASREFLSIVTGELYRPFDLPDWLPLPSKLRKVRSVRQVRGFVKEIIATRRASPEHGGDLLSLLLRAAEGEDSQRRMSDEQVLDEAIGLFRAGHDALSSLLSWTSALMAQHTRGAAHVRNEVGDVTRGRPLAADDLGRLHYTQCVVKESLRLYPPAWMLFIRRTSKHVELTTGEQGFYSIPQGTQVFVLPWSLHRDPRFFTNPARFDPTRFSAERETELQPHAYIPFGIGPHTCIGNAYSLMQATLSVAAMAQRFEWYVNVSSTGSRQRLGSRDAASKPPNLMPEPSLPLRVRGGVQMVAGKVSLDDGQPITSTLSLPIPR